MKRFLLPTSYLLSTSTSHFDFTLPHFKLPTSDFKLFPQESCPPAPSDVRLQTFSARISSARASRLRSRIGQIWPQAEHPRYTKLPEGAIATLVGRQQFSQGVFGRMSGKSMVRRLAE
jgi:hypothetical protein